MMADRQFDAYEADVLQAYEADEFASVLDEAGRVRLRAATRVTGAKVRRVNIRLSSSDVRDIQALALREWIPYQTLISSILHDVVSGRLVERG